MKAPHDKNFAFPAATVSALGNWLHSKIPLTGSLKQHNLALSFD
jgi:hypothetical protein